MVHMRRERKKKKGGLINRGEEVTYTHIHMDSTKVLVVGCGGLGNEVVKNLIHQNVKDITVVDHDTVELSNLSRQFFFTCDDIGRNKAVVIEEKIKERYPYINITSFVQNVESFDTNFFENFDFIMGCLDNISSRMYLNNVVFTLRKDVIYIDGGVEGFRGSVKIVDRGSHFACVQCTIGNYAGGGYQLNDLGGEGIGEADTVPVCSIAGRPTNFTHCVLHAMHVAFEKIRKEKLNVNDRTHVLWIHEEAKRRAKQFHIDHEDYHVTRQIVQNTIPTTISTLMVTSSLMTCQIQTIASQMGRGNLRVVSKRSLDYSDILYVGDNGFYLLHYKIYKNQQCIICNRKRIHVVFKRSDKFSQFVAYIRKKYGLEQMSISTDSTILFMASRWFVGKVYEERLSTTFGQLVDSGKVKERDQLNVQTEGEISFLVLLDLE
ncbi:ubiquitin-activating enzyme, putative [Plasmodium knowlesi strain H]|uniref:NEDD8-activating enzyme E1 catalytic subunit n=3 Tax=Plasmodium knowlesi TaxID=5850 RepID=A0A5K1UKJ6_PLAKH|nr:NEDD8-activating enzyme E1 catalytic subunit, putative [Plasmodium knowlesi strain H]OTN67955.1 putative Ubiquitin-activating enzyme [Plasmodium knowlesi]CAA9986921.1 NEDD8-activating enzyme E1 catalytic subunit, putative [Plasmodium knowlesi strain H]SBO26509.1 ubiquitin-activating enzyme, putative [Plasmodium knowlesi strain H]SBO28125.1 ubiquitin-activating enzyme, putative [Plasmodium knowlesi strain H]VVS76395.1 NEDD8-activating enzyme E1 catalytic subunit, putative [Plasmodium knowles|eukprot:XP_002258168.1 ubiquitin-activating enzyme, putative [Plasmodium knowlesi strain H]